MYQIVYTYNGLSTTYTVNTINDAKTIIDMHSDGNFRIFEYNEISKADVIRKYYQQNNSDKIESCPSCWKEGENNLNESNIQDYKQYKAVIEGKRGDYGISISNNSDYITNIGI